MRSILKFISFVLILSASNALGSVWDESPLETKAQKQARLDSIAKVRQQQAAQDGSQAPNAVRQDNVLVDPRDSQAYKTVEYRGNTWMAENLNFNTPGSFCYENKTENCKKLGRLYVWKSATHACPDGWRLPNSLEMESFLMSRGTLSPESRGGFRKFNGDFYDIGRNAYFWTSETDPSYSDYAFYWALNAFQNWEKKAFYRDQGHSVRCIKDEDPNGTRIYRSPSKASTFDNF